MRINNQLKTVVSLLAVVTLAACSSVVKDEGASKERLASASGFARELQSLASYGLENNQDDTSPRNPAFLMKYIESGQMFIPTGTTITTNGVASGPVMVFDGTSLIASQEQLAASISLIEFGFGDFAVCLSLPEKPSEAHSVSDGPCLF